MTEHKLQVALINFLTVAAKPEIVYFAIPNGGLRHRTVAAKMKAEGLKPGVADLCFMLPGGRSAWLEMKTPTGSLSLYQQGFKTKAEALGHWWAMARTLEEAADILRGWGVLKPNVVVAA